MARRKLEAGTRDSVLSEIDNNNATVAQAAAKFGVHVVTVYRWLRERKSVTTETVTA
jgi:transposase